MAAISNFDFKILRSIAKRPWNVKNLVIHWKFSNHWHSLDCNGNRNPITDHGTAVRSIFQKELHQQAWDRAWELMEMKLLSVHRIHCCPGSDCNLHNYYELRLTTRGQHLLNPPPPAVQSGFFLTRWIDRMIHGLVKAI